MPTPRRRRCRTGDTGHADAVVGLLGHGAGDVRAVPGTVLGQRAVVTLVIVFDPVAIVLRTGYAIIGRAARGLRVADEVVAFQQVADQVRMLRQDAGVDHRHHDALALRNVPRRRCVDAADRVVQVPLVLLIEGIVRHQCRLHVAGTQLGAAQLHVRFGVLHRRVGLQFLQHALQFGRGQAALHADQVRAGGEPAHHLRAERAGAGGAAGQAGTGQRRLHCRQLGRAVAGGGSPGPVLDDDALGPRLGGAGLAHRLMGRQPGGVDGTDGRHRQHGGGKHIDAKVLLLDHVEIPLLGHGSNQHCGHHSLTTPGRPSRDCRDLPPGPHCRCCAGVGGRRRNGRAYQPKPAPTPTELSSLLKAPPKVTVARSLIARW
ncbi:hypothetical protein G6F50_013309 [Rhizopus delemar]|uniref:Uncharacterized protein n=1 Tax=Rhizopus delemar TaxID=936053 RepID=A0A9P6YJG2_9FUNG|nr:hypothetical protein G6F50_013309 [Rhizopus delemar]